MLTLSLTLTTLDTLSGSFMFTTLDLLSGYWQVEVAEEDWEKTAFCTHEGLFHFIVMPFGLCNAPAMFQQLMDLLLAWLGCSGRLVLSILMMSSLWEMTSSLTYVILQLYCHASGIVV